MSNLGNFVQCRFVTPLAIGATEMTLYAADAPYNLPPAEGGLLVLCDSPGNPSFIEVISYTSRTGLNLSGVVRGLEGTTARAWSGFAYCFQSMLAGDYAADMNAKENAITAGTAAQMWLGNKTWASVLSQVQGTLLTGLSLATGTAITAADTVLSGLGKLQKQITDAATNLAANVRAVALTGYLAGSNTALAATDTILAAMGKLQGQLNARAPLTGEGTSGSWPISVTGNAARARPQRSDNASWDLYWSNPGGQPTYYLGSTDGATVQPYAIGVMNVGSATKLATARTINGVPFDGTANITIAAGETGRLPLTGGTLTGRLNGTSCGMVGTGNDYSSGAYEVIGNGASNTVFPTIGFHQPSAYASSLQLRGASDFRFYAQGAAAYANVTANIFYGTLSGNASSASSVPWSGVSGKPTTLGGYGITNGYAMDGVNTGWFRSYGGNGWYNQDYGGGIHMTDSTYVRVYNGKAFYCAGNEIVLEGTSPTLRLYDTDNAINRYVHANGGTVGFLRSDGNWGFYNDNSGNTYSVGNVTAYSDIRLKTDIEVIPDALAKVMKLRGVTYTRIDSGERQTGVIAQEIKAVLPEAVMVGADEDATLSVAYGNLVGLLIEAIKELKAEVDVLKQGAK
jgi:hypothetical protein